uniref:Uncharacterized protein n=1 Tax=Plectus sambesii TaxID=2011161 RepID=A0A914VM35_9BILA
MDTEDQRRRRPAESQMSPLTELILKLRSLPKLPNIFGGDSAQASQSGERSSIWTPPVVASTPSYFANPLADALYPSSSAQSSPFFSDVRRDENRSGKDESTANDYPSLRRSPRRHTVSTSSSPSAPLGRHTRFRITGTTEEGSPGVG